MDQKTRYRALDHWFKTPQGMHVGQALTARLMHAPEALCGNLLVQLGGSNRNVWLDALTYRRKCIVTPCLHTPKSSIISALDQLPLDRNTVDCVISPFVFEAFGWNNNPLDEIDRVLKPMGHLILFGINPVSLWGLALRTGYINCVGSGPVSLISPWFLKQRLVNRGYRQTLFETFYYIPPVHQVKWMQTLAFLNEMGKLVAPCPAGFYCLIMQKHTWCRPPLIRRMIARRQWILVEEPTWVGS